MHVPNLNTTVTTNPIEIQIQAHIAVLPPTYNTGVEAAAILAKILPDPDFPDWAAETAALEAVMHRIQRHVKNQRSNARNKVTRMRKATTTKKATTKAQQARQQGATPAQAKSIGRQFLEIEEAVNKSGDRKQIIAMDNADLDFVISKRQETADVNAKWAEFFRGLNRKVRPGQTVGQVFTERQIENMARSVGLIP